jgi:hypothetical protein
LIRLLFDIAVLGLFTASFGIFIDFCMLDGNIFGWYGKFLVSMQEKHPSFAYWSKPIGGCVFCTSTWVFIVFFLCLVPVKCWSRQEILVLFLGIGVNHIFLSMFKKITD